MDPYCGLHNSVWSDVRKDLESARHLQERKDEEKGELLYVWSVHFKDVLSFEPKERL